MKTVEGFNPPSFPAIQTLNFSKVLGIITEDFFSRPRPRPRTLLFVLEASRGRGQVLEDTSVYDDDDDAV